LQKVSALSLYYLRPQNNSRKAEGGKDSDAEVVAELSAAYEGTPESSDAAKKPHKLKKTAEKSAVFNISFDKLYFQFERCKLCSVAFVLRRRNQPASLSCVNDSRKCCALE
jgi:hypothetical protein